MITKGIIVSVDWTNSNGIQQGFTVKVNIPFLNTIQDAIICTLPQCNFIPVVGDVVIVSFEDYDVNKPVIIGCLFKESGNVSLIDLNVQCLTTNSITKLSNTTTIGDITYDELKNLKGLQQNLQSTIKNIEDRLNKLEGNN